MSNTQQGQVEELIEAPSASSSNAAATPELIKCPRSYIFELILATLTFGLYLSYWFYRNAKDLNTIGKLKLTPWMWIFVPLLAIPLFIAVPNLCKEIKALESKLHLPSWSKTSTTLWLISFFSYLVIMTGLSFIELEPWQELIPIFGFSALLLMLVPRMNRIKQASGMPSKKLYGGFTPFEWIIGSIFAVFWVAVIMGLTMIASESAKTITTYSKNREVSLQAPSLTFQTFNLEWEQVDIGTLSDGTALYEMRNSENDIRFIVFEHDETDSISSLSQWRAQDFHDTYTGASCSEKRTFIGTSLYVRTQVRCDGSNGSEKVARHHDYLQISDEGYLQIYAFYSGDPKSFDGINKAMTATLQSFQLQPQNTTNEMGQ